MKNTALPILTFPFIILTWFMLLVSYRLEAFQLSNTLVPQSLSHWELNIAGEVNLTEGIFNGIGQIFFLDNNLSGLLLFVAVFWAGWKLGLICCSGKCGCFTDRLRTWRRTLINYTWGYMATMRF